MDICPNCGEDAAVLDDYTGWCDSCSKQNNSNICNRCGQESDHRRFCRKCRTSLWLEKHGDELDRFLAEGLTFRAARRLVTETSKIELTCALCHGPMKKATNGRAFFCTNSNNCRKAAGKLQRLVYKHKMDREEAVRKIVEEEGQSIEYKETA